MNINEKKPSNCRKMPTHSQFTYVITLFALIFLIFRNGVHGNEYIELLRNLVLIGIPSPLVRYD